MSRTNSSQSQSPVESRAESTETRVGEVLGRLREDILFGRFQPNERLRFSELTEEYDVSIGTLREALARLTGDKLVELQNQRGFRVPPVTDGELLDVIRTQKILEVLALEKAIAAGDEEWEVRILSAHHRMIQVERRQTPDTFNDFQHEWEHRHNVFHSELISGCDSPWLLHFCRIIRDQAVRYRHAARVPQSQHPRLISHHEPIMTATLGRDSTRACELLAEHFDVSMEILREGLQG